MLKGKIIKISFVIAMVAFCLNLSFPAHAEEDCEDCDDAIIISTMPGDRTYPQDWECDYKDGVPTIIASDDEIEPEETITLYVNSGNLAVPPYSWEVFGEGYSLDIYETQNDFDEVTLTAPASSGTCGEDYDIVATVTVTDQCGESDEVKIRNTAGTWVRCHTTSNACTGSCECENDGEDAWHYIGDHRIYHKQCVKHYSGSSCPTPYSTVKTCVDDGWTYTFDSSNCPDCATCGDGEGYKQYLWRAYIDYWTCP